MQQFFDERRLALELSEVRSPALLLSQYVHHRKAFFTSYDQGAFKILQELAFACHASCAIGYNQEVRGQRACGLLRALHCPGSAGSGSRQAGRLRRLRKPGRMKTLPWRITRFARLVEVLIRMPALFIC